MVDRRFDRKRRLLTASDYRHVFDKALRVSDRCFTVLARPLEKVDSGQATPRLGLAISKKAIRTAVQRNRVKRLIRESFRHRIESLPDVDIVVLARPGLDRRSNEDLSSSLTTLWDDLTRRHRKQRKR